MHIIINCLTLLLTAETWSSKKRKKKIGLYRLGDCTCVYVYSVMAQLNVSVKDHNL
jgi:hypothetical protein